MKKEYDFSKGERGKFYNPDAEFAIPIYLDSDIQNYINELSIKKKINPENLVNKILKKNIALIKSIQ
jgi:hypothetical protein